LNIITHKSEPTHGPVIFIH